LRTRQLNTYRIVVHRIFAHCVVWMHHYSFTHASYIEYIGAYWSIPLFCDSEEFIRIYSSFFQILPNIEIISIKWKNFGKNMIFCFICFDYKNWITEIKLGNLIKNIFGFTLISYILMKICLTVNVLCVE